jgi:hypothetical protein
MNIVFFCMKKSSQQRPPARELGACKLRAGTGAGAKTAVTRGLVFLSSINGF